MNQLQHIVVEDVGAGVAAMFSPSTKPLVSTFLRDARARGEILDQLAPAPSACARVGVLKPSADLVIDLINVAKFDVVHPDVLRGMDDGFETVGSDLVR